MRLLNTLTGEFVDIPSHDKLPYAILSHTWDAAGEQTYQDVLRLQRAWLPTWGVRSVGLWVLYHLWRLLLLLLSSTLAVLHVSVKEGHLSDNLIFRMPHRRRVSLA